MRNFLALMLLWEDFMLRWGNLPFAPGEMTKTLKVAVMSDDVAGEATETFELRYYSRDLSGGIRSATAFIDQRPGRRRGVRP